MRSTKFLLAALAVVGVVACQKTEIPPVQPAQEEPEAVVPEASQDVQPQEQMDVKCVGEILDKVCQIKEVIEGLPHIMVEINKATSPWSLDFDITQPDGEKHSYVGGSLSLTRGIYHPVILAMNLMVLEMIPITGTVDTPQISKYLLLAKIERDDDFCDKFLELATAGLDVSVMGMYRLAFLRGEDEEGKRTIDLYLCDPSNPDSEPFPLSNLLKMFKS